MEYRSVIGGGLVVCGTLLGVIQGLQYVRVPETAAVLLFNTVPFVLVAGAIVYTGVAIATHETYETYAPLIVSWGVGGAVGFVAVFTLMTGTTEQVGFSLVLGAVDAGSAGGLAGLLIGLYDTRSRQTLATVEQLATKLELLNTYGKVLNQSADVESVSALCIEVVELVLDGNGAIFAIGDGDDSEVIDTTLPAVDSEAFAAVSRAVGEAESLETVTEATGFEALRNGEPGRTIAVPIPAGETTAVLVGVFYDTETLDSKTLDLFEILAAHVSTALSSVDTDEHLTEFTESQGGCPEA